VPRRLDQFSITVRELAVARASGGAVTAPLSQDPDGNKIEAVCHRAHE
jgi:hypothetical protein